MIETPEIVELPEQKIAKIRLKVPVTEIQTVMGPTLNELSETLKAQHAEVIGPWFTHHFQRPTDVFDFEVCFPVANEVKAEGRMEPGVWPAMRVARTVYKGGYEGLAGAWAEFDLWVVKQHHSTKGDLWERYVVGPESGMSPDGWRTELHRPLVG